MKLFLTSSTVTPNLVHSFEELIGKRSPGLKAAFIPDAAYKIKPNLSMIEEEKNELISDLKWEIDEILLGNENVESLQRLSHYDVIYVNGGYSGYLAQVMRKSGFDKLLPELLENNICYVGSSAGSMVLSEIQDAASFYFGEEEPEALQIGGLGLVNFEFYPMHESEWTEDLVDKIKARRNKKLEYYLVRDGQAVSVENGLIRTYGDVIKLNKD
jgi:dipeptidase E